MKEPQTAQGPRAAAPGGGAKAAGRGLSGLAARFGGGVLAGARRGCGAAPVGPVVHGAGQAAVQVARAAGGAFAPLAMGAAMQAALARNARLGAELSRLIADLQLPRGCETPRAAGQGARPSVRWIV